MKTITNDFKNALLQFGREYDNKIGIFDYLIMATESNDEITTESGDDIITRFSDTDYEKTLNNEDIFSVKIITKGELLSTGMQELEFVSPEEIDVGRVIDYRFGLKTGNSYEYINYGKFIVYKKEYDESTTNYTYTCYDFMLKTMRTIGQEFSFAGSTATGPQIIEKICEILSIDFDNSTEDANHKPTPYGLIGHKTIGIGLDVIRQSNMTYRDLLNLICQYFGVSMVMQNNNLIIKLLGKIEYDEGESEWIVNNQDPEIVATLTADYFQDSNITFKNHYGEINALELSGIDEENIKYVQDITSINQNGAVVYSIEKNILINDMDVWESSGDQIAADIFKFIDGVSFQLTDLSTAGVLFLDWLDYYNIQIKGVNYKCLLLNSEITIKSGIEESIYTDEPAQSVNEYTTSYESTTGAGSTSGVIETLRVRGNIYGANLEVTGSINATSVGPELEAVIKQISPGGGGAEIPIQDTAPANPQEDDLWIDTSDDDTFKYYDGQTWKDINGKVTGDTLPIGAMVPYGSSTPPTNWLVCDGSAVSRTTYAELFAVIGTSYGTGDGSTTFNLPNKKGKVSAGYDSAQTEFNAIGKTGGEKTHTLNINEIPSHNHLVATQKSGSGAWWTLKTFNEERDTGVGTYGTSNAGGNQAHNNLQPYETDCWIIKAKQSSGVIANVSNTSSNSQTDTYSCNYINSIFETGSNSNGSYIKYNDGTLICYNSENFGSISVNYQWGNIYTNSNDKRWFKAFPISFTTTPTCTYSIRGTAGDCWLMTNGYGLSSTSPGSFQVARGNSSTVSVEMSYIAIGKWK